MGFLITMAYLPWYGDPLPNRHEWQRGRAKYLPPFPARPPRIATTRTRARFRRCKEAKP